MRLVLHQTQFKMNMAIQTKMKREDNEGGIKEVNHYFNGRTRTLLRGDQF